MNKLVIILTCLLISSLVQAHDWFIGNPDGTWVPVQLIQLNSGLWQLDTSGFRTKNGKECGPWYVNEGLFLNNVSSPNAPYRTPYVRCGHVTKLITDICTLQVTCK